MIQSKHQEMPRSLFFLGRFMCASLLVALGSAALADDFVSGNVVFDGLRSVDQGCLLAEQKIKREKISEKCGSMVSGGRLRHLSDEDDRLTSFVLEDLGGLVVGWEVVEREIKSLDASNDGAMRCDLKARIEVRCQEGQRDSGFRPLSAKLSAEHIVSGRNLHVVISPSRSPYYLTIVQWLPEMPQKRRMHRLFPNRFQPSGYMPAETRRVIPEQYRWVAWLPREKGAVEESLVLVASKNPVAELPDELSEEDFYRWLSEIPLNSRQEIFLPYVITGHTE